MQIIEIPSVPYKTLHRTAIPLRSIAPVSLTDLSALSVLREKPLLNQRHNVGHIHYFTRNLALSLLRECGYEVTLWHYSGAAFQSPLSAPGRLSWRHCRGLLSFCSTRIGGYVSLEVKHW